MYALIRQTPYSGLLARQELMLLLLFCRSTHIITDM
jgi:hypothetical protein